MTEIQRFADVDALAKAAAAQVVAVGQAAIAENNRFTVALSGGSTPKAVFRVLRETSALDWSKTFVFWGDERTVPPDHEDSNYRMAKEYLLEHVPVPQENVYRMPGELDPTEAAARYEATLKAFFSTEGWPRVDLILLGMGDDGHTASLFPGTAALNEQTQWVVANHVPKLDTWRITFTAPLINAAANVTFWVTGTSKADALREVVNGPYMPETYPSQLIEPINGNLVWMVDEAAASLI
ncbi:MAG: 6-phosphogluconolactonase [Anaerolineae bacterium]